MTRFIDELHLVGTLTDDHDTEHNGEHYTTPSILRDDGKDPLHERDSMPRL